MKNYLNKINNVFHLMIAIPLVVFVYLYLEKGAGRMEPAIENEEMVTTIHYILPFIIILETGIAFVFNRRNLDIFPSTKSLSLKLEDYFRISLIKYGILEGAALMAVLGYYLTGSNVFAALYIIVLMVFSVNRPTVYRISRDMKLEEKEKDIVLHKRDLTNN